MQWLEEHQYLFLLILISGKWVCFSMPGTMPSVSGLAPCAGWPSAMSPESFHSCWIEPWGWFIVGTSQREFCKTFGRHTSNTDLNTRFCTFRDCLMHFRQTTLLRPSEWHHTFVYRFVLFKAPYRIGSHLTFLPTLWGRQEQHYHYLHFLHFYRNLKFKEDSDVPSSQRRDISNTESKQISPRHLSGCSKQES